MSYQIDFVQAIIDKSVSNTWNQAVREWEVVGCVEDESRSEYCICGKDRLRYIYTIENIYNGNAISNIGSVCIDKFNQDSLDNEAKCWRKVHRLIDAAVKAHGLSLVPLAPPYYSRKLIRFFYEHDVFQPSRYNGWNGERDFEFMIDMFNAQNWSEAQERKVYAIIRNSIRPFLCDVWRERQEKANK